MTDMGNVPDLASLIAEASAYVERRRYEQARSVIGRGLRHHPDNIDLLYLGACVDYGQGRNAAAMETMESVLAGNPQHVGARRLAGHLLEDKKSFAEAEAIWIGLLRDYPEEPDFYAAYAWLMMRALNFHKAARLAKESLRHEPDHIDGLFVAAMLDVIEGRGKPENLQRLLTAHPEQAQTSIALVGALSEVGRNREALRLAQGLYRSQPDSPEYLELVRELNVKSHWSLIPLYPMQRWGWAGAVGVTLVGLIFLRVFGHLLPPAPALVLSLVWLGYVVYSWVWPSVLRKIV
jgi:tetratricopeptide (TPR) repeat protein